MSGPPSRGGHTGEVRGGFGLACTVLRACVNTLLGSGAQANPGVWTFRFTASRAPGSYPLSAQAEDSYGAFGDPLALTLTAQWAAGGHGPGTTGRASGPLVREEHLYQSCFGSAGRASRNAAALWKHRSGSHS